MASLECSLKAQLTFLSGDERPCQRCIKRHIADNCHDGVRKKAKYLHDAPNEALIPPGGAGYFLNGTNKNSSNDQTSSVPTNVGSLAHASHYYAQAQPQTVDLYSPSSNQSQMPPPMHSNPSFGSSQSPISPQFTSTGSQHTSPLQTMSQPAQPVQYGQALFDPSDPALFNLDISSLNFGNQYGALEFGMLHHMSSSAYDTNGNQVMNSMGQMQDSFTPQYNDGQSILFGQDALINADWQHTHPRSSSSAANMLATPNNTPVVTNVDRQDSINGMPHGYAIGAGPGSMASASPASQADHQSMNESPAPALFMNTSQSQSSPVFTKPALPHHQQQHPVQPPQAPHEDYSHVLNASGKRPRNADYIYEADIQPFDFVAGFHRVMRYLKTHFSKAKQHRIARALAAWRPSLITNTKDLSVKDLAFMERIFQRKLYAYINPVNGFVHSYGTPTLLLRRDGTVAWASKEFTILTGWRNSVLIGKEQNLNVNTGGASGANTAPGSAPGSAVRTREGSPTKEGEMPGKELVRGGVLLMELMDQDSVVEWYEDFARLAFNDPWGNSVRQVKLLKYRTREDVLGGANEAGKREEESPPAGKRDGKDGQIGGEAQVKTLGEKEGLVDCMCIWKIDRDTFEVPMLIIMNVSTTNDGRED